MNLDRVLIYAWNPLVVFEIAHSGHIDALIIFLLLAAILFRLQAKPILTGTMLGLIIYVKLFPLLLLPAFFKKDSFPRQNFKMSGALIATITLVYLPFINAGSKILRFVFELQGSPRFNSGLRYFLTKTFTSYTANID